MMQSADRSKSSRHWIEIEWFPTPGLPIWSQLHSRCPRVMATDKRMPKKHFFLLFGELITDITFDARIRGSHCRSLTQPLAFSTCIPYHCLGTLWNEQHPIVTSTLQGPLQPLPLQAGTFHRYGDMIDHYSFKSRSLLTSDAPLRMAHTDNILRRFIPPGLASDTAIFLLTTKWQL
jgi:hypothetical protein